MNTYSYCQEQLLMFPPNIKNKLYFSLLFMSPLTGVKVYLFTADGSYMRQNQTTDGNGEVISSLPP